MPDCGPYTKDNPKLYPDDVPSIPDSMDITVGNVKKTFSDKEYIFSFCRVDFYILRCHEKLLFVDSQPKSEAFHDYHSTSYTNCTNYFCSGKGSSNCSTLSCDASHPAVWDMTVGRTCSRTDKLLYCTKNTYWTQKIHCAGPLNSGAICSFGSSAPYPAPGHVDNVTFTNTGDKAKDQVVYAVGPQWRSRGTADDNGDVFCHYVLNIQNFASCENAYLKSPCQPALDWIDAIKTYGPSKLPDDLMETVYFHFYLYCWSYFFYGALFRYTLTNQINLSDNGSQLQTFVAISGYYAPKYPSVVVANDDYQNFVKTLLQYPTPYYDSKEDAYFLDVYMDIQSFESILTVPSPGNTKEEQWMAMNNALKVLLLNFFQESRLVIVLGQQTKPPVSAEYEIITAWGIRTTHGKYEYNTKSLATNDPDPFGFSSWIANAAPTPFDGNAALNNTGYVYQAPANTFFMPTFVVKAKITRWSPIVMVYFDQAQVFKNVSSDLCTQLLDDTGVYLDACNPCQGVIKDDNQCRFLLSNYCECQYQHPNPTILQIMYQFTLNSLSNGRQCQCFNSLLPPPNLHRTSDPVAMCFNKYCTETDLALVNANNAYCQQNCPVVNEWVHPRDPSNASQNPGLLNQTKFKTLCKVYSLPINLNVLLNGLAIVIMATAVCVYKKQYWWVLCPLILGIGLTVYLAYDLKLESLCNDKGKPFVCRTSLTKIPAPWSFCDYIYCNCFSNEDCPTSCICASGLCAPFQYGTINMATSKEKQVTYNIPLLVTALVLIGITAYVSVKETRPKVRYPVLSVGVVGAIVLLAFFVRVKTVSRYTGPCYIAIPPVLGLYTGETPVIHIKDDFERDNVVFVASRSDQISVVNTNMYLNTSKDINLLLKDMTVNKANNLFLTWNNASTDSGSYMVLSKGNVSSLDGYRVDSGTVTLSGPTSVSFHQPFPGSGDTIHVFATPRYDTSTQRTPIAQVIRVSSDGFEVNLYHHDADGQHWTQATGDVLWFAITEDPDSKNPDTLFEFGTTGLKIVTLKNKYTTPPTVLLSVNATNSHYFGIAAVDQLDTTQFSWYMESSEGADGSWSPSGEFSLTMSYFVIQ